MNNSFLRTAFILLHAALNFLFVNWLLRFDLTGSWIGFIGFLFLMFLLLFIFLVHLVTYINFIKTKTA
jgi:hypothetical protein